MIDCETGVTEADTSNASTSSSFITGNLQGCGRRIRGAFVDLGRYMKTEGYISRKCLVWVFFSVLAIVILGLLAELHTKWGSDRVDAKILPTTTEASSTQELPFWSP